MAMADIDGDSPSALGRLCGQTGLRCWIHGATGARVCGATSGEPAFSEDPLMAGARSLRMRPLSEVSVAPGAGRWACMGRESRR